MIALRKAHPALTYGAYLPQEGEPDSLFTYFRNWEDEKWWVVLNFSNDRTKFPEPPSGRLQRMMGNYSEMPASELRPWEAIVFKLV
jgi:oligo-1,6-glucosidase